MTTYSEIYSLATDFGGGIDVEQFHSEVANEAGITKTFYGIGRDADVISVIFDQALSVGEKTTLDGLVSSHVPTNIPNFKNKQIIAPSKYETSSEDYERLYTFLFPGGTSARIKLTSYMDEDCTSYDIRVVDRTHRTLMNTTNLTNKEYCENNLGILSNVPSTEVTIEIHGKRNGGTNTDKIYTLSGLLEYI